MSKQQLKICLVRRPQAGFNGVQFDFSVRLHTRGSDFSCYANKGYTLLTEDSRLLVSVMQVMDAHPVERVAVQVYTITMYISLAANVDALALDVIRHAQMAGYEVEFADWTKPAVPAEV